MTEASVTQDLIAHLKHKLPHALVFKLSDRITKGVPDIAVSLNGATVWLEVKLLRKGDTPGGRVAKDPLQLLRMRQLHEQTGGRAWFVIYDARNHPRHRGLGVYAPHALAICDTPMPTASVPGFDHQAVVRLLEAV